MSAVLRGRAVPVANRPDVYALEAAKVNGRKAAREGDACLPPLDYDEKRRCAWLDGYVEGCRPPQPPPGKRWPRLVVLRHAWPSSKKHQNGHGALRVMWGAR